MQQIGDANHEHHRNSTWDKQGPPNVLLCSPRSALYPDPVLPNHGLCSHHSTPPPAQVPSSVMCSPTSGDPTLMLPQGTCAANKQPKPQTAAKQRRAVSRKSDPNKTVHCTQEPWHAVGTVLVTRCKRGPQLSSSKNAVTNNVRGQARSNSTDRGSALTRRPRRGHASEARACRGVNLALTPPILNTSHSDRPSTET